MHAEGVKRLPVVDALGRIVGVVSRGDLLKVRLRADADIRRDVVGCVLAVPDGRVSSTSATAS